MPRSKAYIDEVVLERAMHVFWTNGYESTSMRQLEKEMGINQFSIYSSFSNKKNLFLESIRKYREHVKKEVFNSLLQEGAGLAELTNFLYDFVSQDIQNKITKGCLVVNTAAEVGESDPDIAREINNYYDFIRDMLRNVLQNAIANNEIPADTQIDRQANFFLGVLQGLSVASKTMDKIQLNDFISTALAQTK